MDWSSAANSPSSSRRRRSISAIAASLAWRSSSFTRSACIGINTPVLTFHELFGHARRDLRLEGLALLDECVVLVGRGLCAHPAHQRVPLSPPPPALRRSGCPPISATTLRRSE